MKKLIAILAVLIVLAGAVFATEGTVNEGTQRITLKSEVEEKLPNFLLKGSLTSYAAIETAATSATNGTAFSGGALNSDDSIADTDITAYFIISQNASKAASNAADSDYARTQKTISFTFEIGALTQQGVPSGKTAKTIPGTLVSAQKGTAGSYTVGSNDTASTHDNLIELDYDSTAQKFTAVYNGRVQNGQEIGRFTAKWNKDVTAPNGTYKADITVLIHVE